MKCFVCGYEYSENDICPCCGESMPDIIGDQAEAERNLRKLGETLRKEKLNHRTISITAWDMEDGDYSEKDIPVGDAVSLFGTVKWMKKRFYSPVDHGEIEILLKLQMENQMKPIPVRIAVPENSDFLSLGIGIQEGFRPVVVIKNETGTEKIFTGKSILSI